jgi:hypothetical protein
MTDQLGPASRALLDAAREGMTPDAAAIARVKAKVGASVATGGVAAGLATKLTLLAVVGVIATGVLYATRGETIEAAPLPVLVEQPAPPPRAALVETEMEPMIIPRSAPSRQRDQRAEASRVDDRVVVERVPARRPVGLAREVELLDTAMAALRRGEASAALAAARTHASETAGRGQLAEDASAIEIEALCRLGDAAATAKLVAFDKRWPQSAQRKRITAACP